MNRFGFVTVLPLCIAEPIRTIVVSDYRKIREE